MLVVDDEPDMLDFVERVFRRQYVVEKAESVDEAEVILRARPVDVCITDRRMPRRNGLELIAWLAANQPATVRVLLTGYADSLVDEKPATWEHVDAWVQKPIDSVALREAVEDAVTKRATASAG
jgi:response regulator RpfG family c-di-GMP phosphodiesterase